MFFIWRSVSAYVKVDPGSLPVMYFKIPVALQYLLIYTKEQSHWIQLFLSYFITSRYMLCRMHGLCVLTQQGMMGRSITQSQKEEKLVGG